MGNSSSNDRAGGPMHFYGPAYAPATTPMSIQFSDRFLARLQGTNLPPVDEPLAEHTLRDDTASSERITDIDIERSKQEFEDAVEKAVEERISRMTQNEALPAVSDFAEPLHASVMLRRADALMEKFESIQMKKDPREDCVAAEKAVQDCYASNPSRPLLCADLVRQMQEVARKLFVEVK